MRFSAASSFKAVGYFKHFCRTKHTQAGHKQGNSGNVWRTPPNSSAYWDLYLSTRPAYSTSFFSQIFQYHAEHTHSFQTALDIGTGCGQAIPKLAQRFPHVIATDNIEDHILEARARVAHLRQQQQRGAEVLKLDFEVCKAEDLAASPESPHGLFEDESVDLITAGECMPLLDVPVAITNFARLLRPGGTLAMWFYGRPRFTEENIVGRCQPILDEILDRSFRKTVSGGGPKHKSAWQQALRGMRSWLDDIALHPQQWKDVRRCKWNTHAELPFFGERAIDFEAPQPLSNVSKLDKVIELRDDKLWEMRWGIQGVKDFVEASFPGLKEMQDCDQDIQRLLKKIEAEMGGPHVIREFTWPAVLVLASRQS